MRTSAELFVDLDDALARAQMLRDELARRFGFDPEMFDPTPEEPAPVPAPIPVPQGNSQPQPTGDTHMPKVSEMISSKYLRKEDIDDDVVVTCKATTLEDMPGDGGEQRWILHFRELPKGLVLNTTSIRVLEKAFGDHSDNWNGKRVQLYVDPNVQFKGQVVGGLRLRPLKEAKKAPLVPVAPVADPEFNDEIPFGDEKKEAQS
jgi:hypothetical protein